jgi:omega-amidase
LTASPARIPDPASLSDTKTPYPHYSAWGHSTAVSPWGEVIATTDEKESMVVVDLDLSKVDSVRTSIPIIQQKRHDLYKLEQVETKV